MEKMGKEVLNMRSKIKKILDSHLSSYEISRRTGVARQSIDNYRNDESRIDNMTLKNAEKISKLWEEIEMELTKQQYQIMETIVKNELSYWASSEYLKEIQVAKMNQVEENQIIEFMSYDGDGFGIDFNNKIVEFEDGNHQFMDGDMIYIIAPDAEELTADQITSVTTGFGGQGYNIDFSIKGLNADLYIDTDYYEWYDGEEVDENFVRDNFTQIMEDIEDKEVKWSIQN